MFLTAHWGQNEFPHLVCNHHVLHAVAEKHLTIQVSNGLGQVWSHLTRNFSNWTLAWQVIVGPGPPPKLGGGG